MREVSSGWQYIRLTDTVCGAEFSFLLQTLFFFAEMVKVLRLHMAEEVCFLQFKIEVSMDFLMIYNDNFFI
jgi:hypothetical protein